MSKALPDMLGSALEKVKELMDVNTVVGDPITTVFTSISSFTFSKAEPSISGNALLIILHRPF